ncbi:MAG TPA: hypothetical protein VGV89_00155 [Thermoplasmata archaeon]|nr:hypothetical protein [Thermoplasmata archaeon]
MQRCPFCDAAETDRIDLDGHRFLTFACMFTPEVDPALDEAKLGLYLRDHFTRERQSGYFRGMCDRLHLYVAKGEGARVLTARPGPAGNTDR